MKSKSFIFIFSVMMVFMVSCNKDEAACSCNDEATCSCNNENGEATLLNTPTDIEVLTVSDETFMVDFRYDNQIRSYMIGIEYYGEYDIVKVEFKALKTTDDLIRYYESLMPVFEQNSLSINESRFVKAEYMLAQECFSDRCDSKTRKELLQIVTDNQKVKTETGISYPSVPMKSGIFLMAVILVKERDSSAGIIDSETLQQALLLLNSNQSVTRDYSRIMIEYSENFLTNSQ